MKLHMLFLVAALGAIAAPEGSGSALVDIPQETQDGTPTAQDLPPITDGIIGATSGAESSTADASHTESASASSSSGISPSGDGTKPSSSGAASPAIRVDLAKYVGPAAMVVGMGVGLTVVF